MTGFLDVHLDARCWVSIGGKEHWVELEFPNPTTVNAMHFATGWTGHVAPIRNCVLQYEKDGRWGDIPDSQVRENPGTYCGVVFIISNRDR